MLIFPPLFIVLFAFLFRINFGQQFNKIYVKIENWQNDPALEYLQFTKNRFRLKLKKLWNKKVDEPIQWTGQYDVTTFSMPDEWMEEIMELAVNFNLGNEKLVKFNKNNKFVLTIYTKNHRFIAREEFQLHYSNRLLKYSVGERKLRMEIFKKEEFNRPIRHISFWNTSKKYPGPRPIYDRIECKNMENRWGGEFTKESQTLAAIINVCEDDLYLLHYHYADEMQKVKEIKCSEAVFEPNRLNVFGIWLIRGVMNREKFNCKLRENSLSHLSPKMVENVANSSQLISSSSSADEKNKQKELLKNEIECKIGSEILGDEVEEKEKGKNVADGKKKKKMETGQNSMSSRNPAKIPQNPADGFFYHENPNEDPVYRFWRTQNFH